MDLLDPICTRSRGGADPAWEQAMTGRETAEWTYPADPESYAESTYYVRHTLIPRSLPSARRGGHDHHAARRQSVTRASA